MYVNVNGMLFLLLLLYMVPGNIYIYTYIVADVVVYVAVVVIVVVGVVVLLFMLLWLQYMAHDARKALPAKVTPAS